MGGYFDDTGEWVGRKATAKGGGAPDPKTLNDREYSRKMAELSREAERRFPPGCAVQLPDQRIRIHGYVTAHDGRTRVVRYYVVGVYNPSGLLKMHRMNVPVFLRMVGDVKPG